MSRIVRRAARDRRLTRVTSAASVAALLTTLLAACGSDSGPPSAGPQPSSGTASSTGTAIPTASPTPSPTPRPLPTLPRGGRTIFPGHRVIAYYGGSAGPGLGILGAGTPDQAADAIQ